MTWNAEKMMAMTMQAAATGYRILPNGTPVRFLFSGMFIEGKVIASHLNPERKPGIGRVSYDIETTRTVLRVKASDVEPI